MLPPRCTLSCWGVDEGCEDARVVTEAEWTRIRRDLRFGQLVEGTVVRVPRPGAIGIFVERVRPHWPAEVGQPVRDPGPPDLDEVPPPAAN
ncbi:hypothetical protein JCM13580A_63700 [Streptomyces drozdowiczii]